MIEIFEGTIIGLCTIKLESERARKRLNEKNKRVDISKILVKDYLKSVCLR